jgi:nicotinamidase-related amidase
MTWTPLPETVTLTIQTPKPKAFTLAAPKSAVVVVDMQNTSRKSQRSVDVIDGNVRLLAAAREAGAHVIYVQSVRQVESPEHTVFLRPLHRLPGSWDIEIMEEIAPLPGDPVVQKWSHDVWAWHGMEEVLEAKGLVPGEATILVTGVSAAQCANAAALGFSNRGYKTLIPLDCTAAGIEGEARTYALYMSDGYRQNVDFTLSTMVTFAPELAVAQPIAVSAVV